MPYTCPCCGAPVSGTYCNYCGSSVAPPGAEIGGEPGKRYVVPLLATRDDAIDCFLSDIEHRSVKLDNDNLRNDDEAPRPYTKAFFEDLTNVSAESFYVPVAMFEGEINGAHVSEHIPDYAADANCPRALRNASISVQADAEELNDESTLLSDADTIVGADATEPSPECWNKLLEAIGMSAGSLEYVSARLRRNICYVPLWLISFIFDGERVQYVASGVTGRMSEEEFRKLTKQAHDYVTRQLTAARGEAENKAREAREQALQFRRNGCSCGCMLAMVAFLLFVTFTSGPLGWGAWCVWLFISLVAGYCWAPKDDSDDAADFTPDPPTHRFDDIDSKIANWHK